MKKRLLSMLLVLAMLLGGSVACTTDTPPEDTPDDVTPTISFILDGYTEYTLVRGELAGTDEKNAAAALFSALKKATGADIEITTDWNGSHNAPAPTDTLESAGRNHYLDLHGCYTVGEEEKLNFPGFAAELIASGKGINTPYGLVFENGLDCPEFFNGENIPCYYDRQFVFFCLFQKAVGSTEKTDAVCTKTEH